MQTLCGENMSKLPYPLEVKKQTNGDLIISDGFLFWRKEIRIKPDSGKVILTLRGLFGEKVVETDMSQLVAQTERTTEGVGQYVVSGIAGVLCIHNTRVVYTKGNSQEAVLRELNSLNEQLNNRLQILG
jgi:hypothetical protein